MYVFGTTVLLCVHIQYLCMCVYKEYAYVKKCFSPIDCPCNSIVHPSSPLLRSHPVQAFILDPPVDLTVNRSSPATFSCTAQGNPVPTISWTGPSTNFTTNNPTGANFTVSSVLTIDSAVRALHEGVYTCSASNGVGPSPSSNATLTVQGTVHTTGVTMETTAV